MQTLLPSFSPEQVIDSHAQSLSTLRVTAVIPENTGLDVDSDRILEVAMLLGVSDFHRTNQRSRLQSRGPKNLLEGLKLSFVGNDVIAVDVPDPIEQAGAVHGISELLLPIDEHFRHWFGVDSDIAITPKVNLLAGIFSGRQPTDTNRHFDYGRRHPQVSYKIYFDGDPDHSSVYYPGEYRLPRKFTMAMRTLAGIDEPDYPTPQFRKRDEVVHVMPSRQVMIEPWNAYHGGPTDRAARGTRRGILGVTYFLNKIPRE